MAFHPQKVDDNKAANSYKFSEICEAYDVLSDIKKKGVYDQYGEDILKNGITVEKGGMENFHDYVRNERRI